jgi:hypothetical protein
MKIKSHFKIGVPLIFTVLLGSLGLSSIYQTKFDYQETKQLSMEKQRLLKTDKKEKFDIRKAYYDLTVNKNLDDFEYVRVPRTKKQEEAVYFSKNSYQ